MKVKFITKGGEELFGEFGESHGYSFERWFQDRLQHECGMFPYEGGRISVDALIRVEKVVDE